MSGALVPAAMDVDEARRLTERIRYTALSVRDGMEKLQRLVEEARTGQAHVALGYKSWTAYLADTLGKEPLRLARDDRQALVGYLAGEGMSTRAIAPIVGASDITVRRDLSTATNVAVERPATVTSLDGRQRPSAQPTYVDMTTGEVTDRPTAPATPRRPKRDDAETYLNSVQSLADQAAREADKLTSAQIARIKPNAALWVDGIRSSVETLQRLLTSLTDGV